MNETIIRTKRESMTYLLKYDSAAYVKRQASSLNKNRLSSGGLSHVSLDRPSAEPSQSRTMNSPDVGFQRSLLGLVGHLSSTQDLGSPDTKGSGQAA